MFFFQIQTLQNTNMLLKNIQTKERDEKKKLGIKKIKQLRALVQDET